MFYALIVKLFRYCLLIKKSLNALKMLKNQCCICVAQIYPNNKKYFQINCTCFEV